MTKTISILGATGSIGDSTMDLIRQHPEKFEVIALTAATRVEKLIDLAKEFRPKLVAIANESCVKDLEAALQGEGIEIIGGDGAIVEAAKRQADLTVAAIVGAAGLESTLEAVKQGNTVALANKEALVCAGSIVTDLVAEHKTTLLPIDSEHNAIFQVLDQRDKVQKIILTASGGPFYGSTLEELHAVTPAQAVKHPNWDMGQKISVDSATMMNKGLEVIEAAYLFDMPEDQIDVVIHPQSIIHSMVCYKDGSTLAQLGTPDMRIPISYCMTYPDRLENNSEQLDLTQIGRLDFFPPDMEAFPCLKMARIALREGGSAGTVLNAANEVAVASFLGGRIRFTDIPYLIEKALEMRDQSALSSADDILALDQQTRQRTKDLINGLSRRSA